MLQAVCQPKTQLVFQSEDGQRLPNRLRNVDKGAQELRAG
jgi:hypothetical protein